MKHIPLKQYVDSKRQLLAAVKNTPVSIMEYEVCKYCTLPISDGESSSIVPLKPRQKVVVEWTYDNPTQPTPTKVSIMDRDSQFVVEDQEIEWAHDKLSKWLLRYAKDGVSAGHR